MRFSIAYRTQFVRVRVGEVTKLGSYTDGFLTMVPIYDMCNNTLPVLIRLLKKLGFNNNWPKVEGPTQRSTFLGIDISTVDCTSYFP